MSSRKKHKVAQSRKRKRADSVAAGGAKVKKLSKKQCVERLERIDDVLRCPICLETMFAPLMFKCGEHMACFRCVCEMLRVAHPIEQVERRLFKIDGSRPVRCPCCNNKATGFCNVLEMRVLPTPLLSALFSDSTTYCCLFCPHTGSMGSISRHLLTCPESNLCCEFCNERFRLQDWQTHIYQTCTKLPCFHHKKCSWTGRFEEMQAHYQAHDHVWDWSDQLSDALYDAGFLDLSTMDRARLGAIQDGVAELLRGLVDQGQQHEQHRTIPSSIRRLLMMPEESPA